MQVLCKNCEARFNAASLKDGCIKCGSKQLKDVTPNRRKDKELDLDTTSLSEQVLESTLVTDGDIEDFN